MTGHDGDAAGEILTVVELRRHGLLRPTWTPTGGSVALGELRWRWPLPWGPAVAVADGRTWTLDRLGGKGRGAFTASEDNTEVAKLFWVQNLEQPGELLAGPIGRLERPGREAVMLRMVVTHGMRALRAYGRQWWLELGERRLAELKVDKVLEVKLPTGMDVDPDLSLMILLSLQSLIYRQATRRGQQTGWGI
jgi:hypothetical protein